MGDKLFQEIVAAAAGLLRGPDRREATHLMPAYIATSLVNKDDYVLILQYKVSFSYDRLRPCFRFVYICIYLYLYCCVFVLLPFLGE